MAITHQLSHSGETLMLNALYGSGWNTEAWNPDVATPFYGLGPDPIKEKLDIVCRRGSANTLASDIQELDAMRVWADQFLRDPLFEIPVWWRVKMDDETGTRRALVRQIEMSWRTPQVDDCGLPAEGGMKARLEITRQPYWESTTSTSIVSTTNLSCLGGAFDYTATDVTGDAPARLDYLRLTSSQVTGYTEMYLGFRSANKHGTLANFQPLWEIEDGTNGIDASDVVDVTASGGDKVTVSFATEDNWGAYDDWRVGMSVSTYAGGNVDDQFGRFVVLLRAKVDAGTTDAWVRMGQLYSDADIIAYGDITRITATSWTVYNLGLITIPLRNLQAIPSTIVALSYDGSQKIKLYARRESVAGSLDLDCLVLIPADEFFIHIDGASIGQSLTRVSYIGMSPLNELFAYSVNLFVSEAFSIAGVNSVGEGVPIGDGRLYGVLLRDDSQNVLADDWDPSIRLYRRWFSLRGAE